MTFQPSLAALMRSNGVKTVLGPSPRPKRTTGLSIVVHGKPKRALKHQQHVLAWRALKKNAPVRNAMAEQVLQEAMNAGDSAMRKHGEEAMKSRVRAAATSLCMQYPITPSAGRVMAYIAIQAPNRPVSMSIASIANATDRSVSTVTEALAALERQDLISRRVMKTALADKFEVRR